MGCYPRGRGARPHCVKGAARMRVAGSRPIGPAATRRDDKSGVGGAGSFAEALGVESAAAPSVAAPASGVSALFALQEVPDAMARRRKAMARAGPWPDRKNTHLNSSHPVIPYAAFCLTKKENR